MRMQFELSEAGRDQLIDGVGIALAWARRFGDELLAEQLVTMVDRVLATPGGIDGTAGWRSYLTSVLSEIAVVVVENVLAERGLVLKATDRLIEEFAAAFTSYVQPPAESHEAA